MLGDNTKLLNAPATEGGLVPSGASDDKLKDAKPKGEVEETDDVISERAAVKKWIDKITKAKAKWEPEFERMRDNMDFVAGLQWPKQAKIRCDQYVVNMTLRAVNQGVAMLYAKDPKVSARRRQRLDFAVWDGKIESIMQALQIKQISDMSMGALSLPPDIAAVLNDFAQGRQRQILLDKVGKTLEIVSQYQIDTQQPRFKTQMKQLVRRVRTCGVGYIKVLFCRDYEGELTQSETRVSIMDRAKIAKAILDKIESGKLQETDAEMQRLKSLVESLATSPVDYENVAVKEHLTFDFPQATSIIPSPETRALKGFIGTKWIAEEFYYPLDFVNAFFEVDIKVGGDVKTFDSSKKEAGAATTAGGETEDKTRKVRLFEVTDLDTKSTFILCEGHKDFVVKPEGLSPTTKGFWNIFPVTFNDIEVEDGCKATIFPPSDIDLMYSSQVEWNTVRQKLSRHRNANGPKYGYRDGSLSEDDLERITSAEDQEFVAFKGLDPSTPIEKAFSPLTTVRIDQELYTTEPLREDILLATGQQEANIGPAQPNVTATVGTIAEQSRMSVAASDVDGLDDSLTDVFQCGGEMMLREMSVETVKKIAGPGAVWPMEDKEGFLNEIELEVVAASSGRPNKAIEIANWERLGQLLMSAGANPQAVIKESIRRLDDRLEPMDFFPLPVPMGQPPQGQPPSPANGAPPNAPPRGSSPSPKKRGQPLQPNGSGAATPLAGHRNV